MEVIALHSGLELFLSEFGNQKVMRRMRILSLYHAHCNLMRAVLDVMYPKLNLVGDRAMSNVVGKVLSSLKGNEGGPYHIHGWTCIV